MSSWAEQQTEDYYNWVERRDPSAPPRAVEKAPLGADCASLQSDDDDSDDSNEDDDEDEGSDEDDDEDEDSDEDDGHARAQTDDDADDALWDM